MTLDYNLKFRHAVWINVNTFIASFVFVFLLILCTGISFFLKLSFNCWFASTTADSSDSSGPGSPSRQCFVSFKVYVYVLNYEGSLDARRFQAIRARGDSRSFYDTWHVVNLITYKRACIKRCAHWSVRSNVLRYGIATRLEKPSLPCTDEYGHNVRIAETVRRQVTVTSSKLPVITLDFKTFHRPSIKYMCIATLINGLKRLFRSSIKNSQNSCYFVNWNFADLCTVSHMLRSWLFLHLPYWCRNMSVSNLRSCKLISF